MTNSPSPQAVSLRECPFCGGEAEIIHLEDGDNAGGSCVCCTSCQASGNVEFGFKENFVENWNRRAPPEDGVAAPLTFQRIRDMIDGEVCIASDFGDSIDDDSITDAAKKVHSAMLAAPPALAAASAGGAATLVGGAWKNGALSRLDRVKAHRMAFGSDLKTAVEAVDEEVERQRIAALSARPAPAGGGEDNLPPISLDGPYRPNTHRRWLSRKLLDSKLTDDEAYGIVRCHPAISDTPPSPDADKLREAVRLALEDADALDRTAEDADENQWPDWSATMRQAAGRIRALARLSTTEAGG